MPIVANWDVQFVPIFFATKIGLKEHSPRLAIVLKIFRILHVTF
jgi:hypothetical protein